MSVYVALQSSSVLEAALGDIRSVVSAQLPTVASSTHGVCGYASLTALSKAKASGLLPFAVAAAMLIILFVNHVLESYSSGGRCRSRRTKTTRRISRSPSVGSHSSRGLMLRYEVRPVVQSLYLDDVIENRGVGGDGEGQAGHSVAVHRHQAGGHSSDDKQSQPHPVSNSVEPGPLVLSSVYSISEDRDNGGVSAPTSPVVVASAAVSTFPSVDDDGRKQRGSGAKHHKAAGTAKGASDKEQSLRPKYIAAAVNFLLTVYSSFLLTVVALLHCVHVPGTDPDTTHLFIQGSVECVYSGWQAGYVIAAACLVALPCAIPFATAWIARHNRRAAARAKHMVSSVSAV